MKKIILLFFVATFATNAQNKVFTLEQSLETGLKNSKELKIAESKVIEAEAKANEVFSNFLPQISLSSSYTRLSDVPPFEVQIPFGNTKFKIQDPILNNYAVVLSLKQPIFTGFRLSSLNSAAKLNYESVKADFEKIKNETAFGIRKAFWNFYKVKKVLEVVNQNLVKVKTQLEKVRNFYENGVVTESDVLKLEVLLSEINLKKLDTENKVNLARIAFNKTLGIELSEKTEIVVDSIETDYENLSFQESLNEAMKNRFELKSVKYKLQAAGKNVSAFKSGWLPSLFLFGDFQYSRPNQRLLPLEDKFYDTWDVGVALSWKLWDWGETSSKVTQAEQRLIQAENSEKLLREAIEMEVYKNYLNLVHGKEKISASRIALESAKENYRVTAVKYSEQVIPVSDLVDAQSSLLDAQVKLQIALVDFELAKTEFYKSLGRKIYLPGE